MSNERECRRNRPPRGGAACAKPSKPSSRDGPNEEDPIEDWSDAFDDDLINHASEDEQSKDDDDAFYKLWRGILRNREDDSKDKSQAAPARKKAKSEA